MSGKSKFILEIPDCDPLSMFLTSKLLLFNGKCVILQNYLEDN